MARSTSDLLYYVVVGLLAACALLILSGCSLIQVRRANEKLAALAEVEGVVKLPAGLLFFGRFFELGSTRITYGSILMLLIFAVAWYALTQTAWGKHVYATGNNAEAARRSGIRVSSLLLLVYTIAGLIYGIAGLLLLGRVTVGDPLAGATSNLDSITAVVIGGTSLFGGRGSVINTLIGALIVGVLRNGLTLVGIDALYQTLATGILVILAVALDQLARSRAR